MLSSISYPGHDVLSQQRKATARQSTSEVVDMWRWWNPRSFSCFPKFNHPFGRGLDTFQWGCGGWVSNLESLLTFVHQRIVSQGKFRVWGNKYKMITQVQTDLRPLGDLLASKYRARRDHGHILRNLWSPVPACSCVIQHIFIVMAFMRISLQRGKGYFGHGFRWP